MKTEYFKKVYIKSEEDLPKETGRYLGHEKCFKSQDLLDSYHYDKDDKDFCCDWLNTFDWYLLPVPMPSEEEIERETPAYCGLADEAKAFQAGATWLKSRLTD